MSKEKYRLNNKHKSSIASKVIVLILAVVFVSYMFKIFGSDLFNKFITNNVFISISSYIDNIVLLNILAYGILGFIIILFTFLIEFK